MASDNDKQQFKSCFIQIIDSVSKCSIQIKKNRKQSKSDQKDETSFENCASNNDVFTFSLDNEENQLLNSLTTDIETIVKGSVKNLSKICADYLLDFLYTYDYDNGKQKFTSTLNFSELPTFHKDCLSLLDSLDAYSAAFNGDLAGVKKFLENHPQFKDKPGLWGTTLLYSATRNGHHDIVKYLIEDAHCAVNAQNQRDLDFALKKVATHNPRSMAASTALHVACFNNHSSIVKYLVEKNADYFIQNQAYETPIMNGEKHPDIKQYFQNYFVLNYSAKAPTILPNQPIIEDIRRPFADAIWEYKPFNDPKWYKFTSVEAKLLHDNLLPSNKFQKQICLNVTKGFYSVSMIEFLRSGRYQIDPEKNMAWIRCRGSSILNFDSYSVWEIMVIAHDKVIQDKDAEVSLKVEQFPTTFDSRFKLHLNNWYMCDVKTNTLLDDSMNYRRKIISFDVPHIGNRLAVNLETFEFSNDSQTIKGYIRWIPKFISSTEKLKKKILYIDNYQPNVNHDPTPLTTNDLGILKIKHSDSSESYNTVDDSEVETLTTFPSGIENYDDSDDGGIDDPNDKRNNFHENMGSWSVADLGDEVMINNITSDSLTSLIMNGKEGKTNDGLKQMAEDFFTREVNQFAVPIVEKPNSTLGAETVNVMKSVFEAEINELKDQVMKNESIYETLKQSQINRETDKDKRIDEQGQTLKGIREKLEIKLRQEKQFEQQTINIIAVDYTNIERLVAQSFISSDIRKSVIDRLKAKHSTSEQLIGIPKVETVESSSDSCLISVTGFQVHHAEFKLILQRMSTLAIAEQGAKTHYRHHLCNILQSFFLIMTTQFCLTQDWKDYVKYFQKLCYNKAEEFIALYDNYMSNICKTTMNEAVNNVSFDGRSQLRKLSDMYMKKKLFEPELEILKAEALDEFIKQNIILERKTFENKPTKESHQILSLFLNELRAEIKTNPIYLGFQFENLQHISKLIKRIMLYYHAYLLQLPLYESSKELLDKIRNNTIITVATPTGSGKSSLLPVLLIADNYEKVIVTQPRRLLCTAICNRVNQTMIKDNNEMKLAGLAVNDSQSNVNAQILYITDSILKERLLNDHDFIPNETKIHKPIVFFIDEVHERSINVDLCLALVARLLTDQPSLHSKIKVIISSATLDPSIPKLFRQIPKIKLEEFKMPTFKTVYPVEICKEPNRNILDLVQELCRKRQRHDQILCFVSSVTEVYQCCDLLKDISNGTLLGCPLIQSQSATAQKHAIEQGSVFFSTNVAETSLTFPSLTYVIDTGMINIPIFDFNKRQTTVTKVNAAESTIKQRLGRLGRTKVGRYYSLYGFNVEDKKYSTPQICQSDITNTEFALRRSQIRAGLNYMKKFLPDPPDQAAINAAINELKRLDILDSNDKFTKLGAEIAELPNFGSIEMSKSIYAALNYYNCGRDLIILWSILSVLDTSTILSSIPNRLKSSDGDFKTLLNVMNEILFLKESIPAKQFKLAKVCEEKGLMSTYHILKQALKRYTIIQRSFSLSNTYRHKAQMSCTDWESIAKALVHGYTANIFVSMRELQGKSHLFTRYSSTNQDEAVLDYSSTVSRPMEAIPVAVVLARDIRFSSSIRKKAVLSFVGEIKSQWVDYRIKRSINLNGSEIEMLQTRNIINDTKKTFPNVNIKIDNKILVLEGSAGLVLDAELDILKQLVIDATFPLYNLYSADDATNYARMKQNLASVMKMPFMFRPMICRWQTEHQVKITVHNNGFDDACEIKIEGRHSKVQMVVRELDSFLKWLKECAVIRHPNAGVPPRILKPQMRQDCLDIEERISRITDSKRTPIEIWRSLKGSQVTRESRMEVVAWIAVTLFDCRLEGGFVRDWVVGNYRNRPAGNPSTWVHFSKKPAGEIPELDKDLIPSDLDCHLPLHKYFDIDQFLDELHKYQIEYKFVRENWRYIVLLDEKAKTGPFSMDLIESHVALTQDRIDFDVSNLSLEKDYTKELGMRVDIQQEPYSIELECIVDNIKNKCFQVLRPLDDNVRMRIDKMQKRGWKQCGKPTHVIPNPPPNYHVIVVPLPKSNDLYKSLVEQIQKSIGRQTVVHSIVQIKNPLLEDTYVAMKQLIAKECRGKNPNERELFHGASGDAIEGILNNGYDDRFWESKSLKFHWGRGAYFSDNPNVSHGYTEENPKDKTRVIYYNKVILGSEHVLQDTNCELRAAPKGYHSIRGTLPDRPDNVEYVVYRYGQALPYLKIIYST